MSLQREQKLLEAKLKLERFQKQRSPTQSYQAQLNGQPLLSQNLLSRSLSRQSRPQSRVFTRPSSAVQFHETQEIERKLDFQPTIADVLRRNKILADKITSLEKEILELRASSDKSRVQELEELLEKAQLELKQHETSSQTKLIDLQSQLTEYLARIQDLEQELQLAQEQSKNISETNVLLGQESGQEEISSLKEEIQKHIQTEQELRDRIQALVQVSSQTSDQEISHLSDLLSEKQEALGILEQKLFTIEQEHQMQVDQLMKQIDELQRKLENTNDGWEGNWDNGDSHFYPGKADQNTFDVVGLQKRVQELEQERDQMRSKFESERLELETRIKFLEQSKSNDGWEGDWDNSDAIFLPKEEPVKEPVPSERETELEHQNELLNQQLESFQRIQQELQERLHEAQEQKHQLEHKILNDEFQDLERAESSSKLIAEKEALKLDNLHLEQQIQELQQEMSVLRQKQSEPSQETELLVETLRNLTDDNKQLKHKVHEMESKHLESITKVMDLEDALDVWKKKHQDVMVQYITEKALLHAQMEHEITEKNDRLEELELSLSRMSLVQPQVTFEAELELTKQEYEAIIQEKDVLIEQLQASGDDEQLEEAEERINLLEGIIQDNNQKFELLVKQKDQEIQELQEQNQAKEQDLNVLKQNLLQMQAQADEAQTVAQEWQDYADETVQQTRQECETIIKDYADQMRQMQDRLLNETELKQQIADLEEQLASKTKQSKDLEQKLDQALSQTRDTEYELSNLKQELINALAVSQQHLSETENVRQLLQQAESELLHQANPPVDSDRVAGLESQVQELTSLLQDTRNLNSSLLMEQERFLDMDEENTRLKQLLEEQKQKIQTLPTVEKVQDLEQEVVNLQEQVSRLMASMDDHESLAANAQMVSRSMETQTSALKEENLRLLTELQDLTVRFDQATENANLLESQLTEAHQVNNEWQGFATSVEEEKNQILAERDQLSVDLASTQVLLEEKSNQIQDLEARLASVQLESNFKQSDDPRALEGTIQDLTQTSLQKDQELSFLQIQLTEREQELLVLQGQLTEREQEISILQNQLTEREQLKEQVSQMQEQLLDLELKNQQESNPTQELKHLQEEHHQLQAQFESVLNQQYTLESQLQVAVSESEHLKQQLLVYEQSLTENQSNLTLLQDQFDQKILELQEIQEVYAHQTQEYEQLQVIYNQLLEQVNQKTVDQERMQDAVNQKQQEQQETQTQLLELQELHQQQTNELFQLQAVHAEQEEQLQQEKLAYSQQQEQFESLQTQFTQQSAHHAVLLEENRLLLDQIQELEQKQESLVVIQEKQTLDLENLTSQLDADQMHVRELEQLLEQAQENLNESQERVQELESQVHHLKSDAMSVDELQKQMQSLEQTKHDLELSQMQMRQQLDEALDLSHAKDQEIARLTLPTREDPRKDQRLIALERDLQQLAHLVKQKEQQLEQQTLMNQELMQHAGKLEQMLKEPQQTEDFDMHKISGKDLAVLTAKAAQSDQSLQQLEVLTRVLDETHQELSLLRETIQVLVKEASVQVMESGSKKLTKQFEELRKVWSQELQTNNMLRKLFTKNQQEMTNSQQQVQKIIVQLREECDSTTRILEKTLQELSALQMEKEGMVVKHRLLSRQLDELSESTQRDLQRQLYIQHEAHEKECQLLKSEIQSQNHKRERLMSEHQQELEDLVHKHQKEIKQIKSLMEERVRKLSEQHQKSINAVKESLGEEQERIKSLNDDKIKKLQSQMQQEMKMQESMHQQQLQSLENRFKEEKKKMEQDHMETKRQDQLSFDRTLKNLEQELKDHLVAQEQLKKRLAQSEDARAVLVQDLESKERQLSDLLSDLNQTSRILKQEQERIKILESDQDKMEALKRQVMKSAEDLQDQRSKNKQLEQLYQQGLKDLEDAKKQHKEELDQLQSDQSQKQSQTILKEHKQELADKKRTIEQQLQELEESRSKIQELTEKLQFLEQKRIQREQEHQKELEQSRSVLRQETKKLEQSFQEQIKLIHEAHDKMNAVQKEAHQKFVKTMEQQTLEKIQRLELTQKEESERVKKDQETKEVRLKARMEAEFQRKQDLLSEEHQKSERQSKIKILGLEERLDHLQDRLKRQEQKLLEQQELLSKETESLKTKLKTAQERSKSLEQQLSQQSLVVKELESKLQQETLEHQSLESRSSKQITSLKSELQSIGKQLEQSNHKLSQQESQLHLKELELEKVTKSNEQLKIFNRDIQSTLNAEMEQLRSFSASSQRQTWESERLKFEQLLNQKDQELSRLETLLRDEKKRLKSEFNQEMEQVVQFEQERAREILNSRLSDLRYKYDHAIESMRQQRRKLESMLDEAEQALIEEREQQYHRSIEYQENERNMMDEIRSLEARLERRERHERGLETPFERPDRWASEKRELERELQQMEMEQEKERHHYERKIFDLVGEARHLERTLSEQEEQFMQEREQLLDEIAKIKEELALYQVNTQSNQPESQAIILALQEDKKKLEERLQQQEEQNRVLDKRSKAVQFNEQERERLVQELKLQKEAFEMMIAQRDQDLTLAKERLQRMKVELDSYLEKQTQYRDYIDPETFSKLRRQAETQIRFERDRAKRLAYKIEELKERNKRLKKQFEDGEEDQEHKHKTELQQLLQERIEMVASVRQLHHQLFEEGESILEPEELDLVFVQETCVQVSQEIHYMRGLVNRLMLWRADLKYQKLYLSLKVDDLLASHKTTLAFIHGMGVQEQEIETSSPSVKLKRCVNAVVAVFRMRILARQWQEVVQQ